TAAASVSWYAASSSADMLLNASADFTATDRMSIDPKIGAMVVPSELNACVKFSLLEAVSGLPKIVTYGFAATCNRVMPDAKTKKAVRNKPYDRMLAEG